MGSRRDDLLSNLTRWLGESSEDDVERLRLAWRAIASSHVRSQVNDPSRPPLQVSPRVNYLIGSPIR